MSTQPNTWSVRGESNQPAGRLTAQELIQSWRAGSMPTPFCWCKDMAQWLPMGVIARFWQHQHGADRRVGVEGGAVLQHNGDRAVGRNLRNCEPCPSAHLATEGLSMNAIEDAAALSGEPFG